MDDVELVGVFSAVSEAVSPRESSRSTTAPHQRLSSASTMEHSWIASAHGVIPSLPAIF